MKFSRPVRLIALNIAVLATIPAATQDKPQPTVSIDLKPLGAAPDLFATPSDSKNEQRGIINVFWVGDERVAVAFSSNRRWTSSAKPEPLEVRLVIFDRAGKQLNERDWKIGAEGPAAEGTLDLLPGPDNSILAIHESVEQDPAPGRIPEGNFVQVLNADTSLRQNFYIPNTSVYAPGNSSEPVFVLQTFFADRHSELVWWNGKPLKPGIRVELPKSQEPVLAGPNVAARVSCATETLCSGVRVFRAGAAPWNYKTPAMEYQPIPHLFLSSAALLIELRHPDQKQGEFVVAHQDGSQTQLAPLPKGQQVSGVTSVSSNGQRFSVDTSQESGLCGALDLFCKERGNALLYDIPANKIVFGQEVSANGAVSAVSPDGRKVAIFDRDRLAIYAIP